MSAYRCILADPPWQYEDRATRGAAARHYPTLPLSDLLALPVRDLVADHAHLWLWTTNQMLADGIAARVAYAWGFVPKTLLTWVKTTRDGSRPRIGTGHYLRNATEHILFAVRGKLGALDRSVPSYFLAPASKLHSRKPDVSYTIIERISPGPRLELFATRRMPGWDAIGYAMDGLDIREALQHLLQAGGGAPSCGFSAPTAW